jgi:hypothetical protein
MTENKYRVQDENGIVQVETLRQGLELIQMDPDKLAFITENSTGKVVTVWMRDTVGIGDVWIWNTSPEFKHEVNFYLDEIERDELDQTGVPKKYREEIEKMLTGRGAEKIYLEMVEKVDDYARDNVSYPFDQADEDEVAQNMLDYAWTVFKLEFLSDRHTTKES